jgi:hypothetical protein
LGGQRWQANEFEGLAFRSVAWPRASIRKASGRRPKTTKKIRQEHPQRDGERNRTSEHGDRHKQALPGALDRHGAVLWISSHRDPGLSHQSDPGTTLRGSASSARSIHTGQM